MPPRRSWTKDELCLLGTAADEVIAARIGASRAAVQRARVARGIGGQRRAATVPIGRVFGLLTVIGGRQETYDGQKRSYTRYYWTCHCACCGETAEYIAANVRRGITRSCGRAQFGMSAKKIRQWRNEEQV